MNPLTTALSKPKNFFFGAGHAFSATLYLIRTPSLWWFIIVPIIFMGACFVSGIVFLVFFSDSIHQYFLSFGPDIPTSFSDLSPLKHFFWIVYEYGSYFFIWFAGILISYSIGISVAPILSEGISDAVVKKQSLQSSFPIPTRGTPWYISIIESIVVSFVYLIFTILLFFLALIPLLGLLAPILGFICTSLFLCKEILDVPLTKYNFSFSQKVKIIRKNIWLCMGFGGTLFFMALVPLYNLFLFPIAVIGATTMWYQKIAPTLGTDRDF